MAGTDHNSRRREAHRVRRASTRGFWRTYSVLLVVGLVLGTVVMVAQTAPSNEAETSDQHLESQLRQTGTDILSTANASGRLANATVYWDPEASRWHNATRSPPSEEVYSSLPADHPLRPVLAAAERGAGQIAINIEITYQNGSGGTATQRLLYQGPPGRNAVQSTYQMALLDDDRIVYPDGSTGCTLKQLDTGACSGSYFAPDASSTGLYNTVRVTVIIWKP